MGNLVRLGQLRFRRQIGIDVYLNGPAVAKKILQQNHSFICPADECVPSSSPDI
jgi:hypothetical protein